MKKGHFFAEGKWSFQSIVPSRKLSKFYYQNKCYINGIKSRVLVGDIIVADLPLIPKLWQFEITLTLNAQKKENKTNMLPGPCEI